MKKTKCVLLSLLIIFSIACFTGCGNENKDDSGSNTNSNSQSTESATNKTDGVIEQIITDAATEIKDAVTKAEDLVDPTDQTNNGNTDTDGQNVR